MKLQILEMGFEKEQVDLCAATLESVGDEMSVPNMLKSLADAERVAAAARSPAHAAAKAASEAAAATADEPDNVCCICLDDFETNKALYITERQSDRLPSALGLELFARRRPPHLPRLHRMPRLRLDLNLRAMLHSVRG